jgi:hypothetical protein
MRKTNILALTTFALLFLLSCGASAQEKIFKFELNQQDLQIIATALGKQPYEAVARTMAELQRQIDAQTKPKIEEPKENVK